jgi:hypothetical protein
MNRKDFIRELSKVRNLFEWKLIPDNNWRPERRSECRLHSRATSVDAGCNVVFEPIGALCYTKMGVVYTVHEWFDAAASLGLTDVDAWDVMAAGNDLTWRQFANGRSPLPEIKKLRDELAAAVGLEIAVKAGNARAAVSNVRHE